MNIYIYIDRLIASIGCQVQDMRPPVLCQEEALGGVGEMGQAKSFWMVEWSKNIGEIMSGDTVNLQDESFFSSLSSWLQIFFTMI